MSSLISKAENLRIRGKYEDAIKCYIFAIESGKVNLAVYVNLSVCYMAIGDYRKALVITLRSSRIYKAWPPESVANAFICASEYRPILCKKFIFIAIKSIANTRDELAQKIINAAVRVGIYHEAYIAADIYQKTSKHEVTFIAQKFKICGLSGDLITKKKHKDELIKKYELNETNGFLEDPYTHLLWSTDPCYIKTNIENFIANNLKKTTRKREKSINSNYNNRIRLAYISSDFYNHATLHLIIEVLESHDKSKFDLYFIDYSRSVDQSEYRRRFESIEAKILKIKPKNIQKSIENIKKLKLDFAIDLKGYTKDACLDLFSERIATYQGSFLGFPGPLLYEGIDFNIVDKYVMDEAQIKVYNEDYIFLECYQPNDSKRTRRIAEKNFHGILKICNINAIQKINYEDILFAGKLINSLSENFENIELCLINPGTIAKDQILKILDKILIKKIMVTFLEKVSPEEHHSRVSNFHLAIDTLVYGGHTTSSELLWSGVPIITVPGKTFQSRVTYSLLKNLNMDFLSFDNESLAVEFCRFLDWVKLEDITKKLNTEIGATKIFDGKHFCKNLENGLLDYAKKI